jgi:hypothetical protein
MVILFELKKTFGENWPLVTDVPVEVQDIRKNSHYFRGIYGLCLKLMKKN